MEHVIVCSKCFEQRSPRFMRRMEYFQQRSEHFERFMTTSIAPEDWIEACSAPSNTPHSQR
jgi:hypothetical protein